MGTLEELGLLKMDFSACGTSPCLTTPRAGAGEEPGFRSPPSRRTTRDLPDDHGRKDLGRLSDGKRGLDRRVRGAEAPVHRRTLGHHRALPPRPHGVHPALHRLQAQPGDDPLQAPHARGHLSVTYGCIVYQEQVIEISADGRLQPRAGGHGAPGDFQKKAREIEKERKTFIGGDEARGIPAVSETVSPAKTAESIYDEIYDFANYAFNKAHAVAYAVIAYQTAWFKCHRTKEYMALSSDLGPRQHAQGAEYIAECRDWGSRFLPPDI
jgi:DNA polymerase-3 subunit alpha